MSDTFIYLSQLSTALIHIRKLKLILEAMYDKTWFLKCNENLLAIHFDYLNITVAQKLTKLKNVGYF